MRNERFYSIDIATQIGALTRSQVAQWARNGTFVPSILYSTDHRPFGYLYSLADLVALKIISVLRSRYRLPLSEARIAADYVRTDSDTAAAGRFWIVDNHVHISDPQSAAATLIEVGPIAEQVQVEADRLWQRSPDDYGRVERKRNVMNGALVVKGTRIPVSTVVALVTAGWDIDRIRKSYPTLQPEDIQGIMQYAEEQRQVA